ncbi:hypothetical protein [Marinagarivorans cellulosilyticus]|uniref:Uncharacterized protein n=1 Tax=Marinagarivorans cellulosilyticus TaxID=2721545 RepID=A0AAN1WIJ8_9GAMM|nr:hypothetical protein [Marinagarivorans cellulosilyticus]BCD98195.1 hypothetical protein MARGE09_P2396 [Marinagarivorans cellulosilyticus]
MKRKERKLIFRIINAISSLVLLFSCVYLYFWGFSVAVVAGAVVALCCVAAPVALAGEGAIEAIVGVLEALCHALVDAVVGIFEAIGNIFN